MIAIAVLVGCTSIGEIQKKSLNNTGNNLVKNGEFSETMKDWLIIGEGINHYHPEDPGRASFSIEDGILKVKIINPGISIWSIMLYQSIDFVKGHTYTISFDAKSEEQTTLVSNIVQDTTWINYSGDHTFVLSGSMKTYSYEYVASKNITALFQLCVGNDQATSIYLDNVLIIEKK